MDFAGADAAGQPRLLSKKVTSLEDGIDLHA